MVVVCPNNANHKRFCPASDLAGTIMINENGQVITGPEKREEWNGEVVEKLTERWACVECGHLATSNPNYKVI